jgi:hypothetical protein
LSALREQLLIEQPQLCKFLDDMKAGFDSVVLHVSAPGIERGKEPPAGIRPYVPMPSDTWDYAVGKSPGRGKK